VILCVGDVLPDDVRKGEVIDRKLESILNGASDVNGSRVKRVRREKMPFLGSHWK
jgi:hypothetical protein